MYHPYFRGKQYELITVRETAPMMAAAGFTPIIEPVKESLGGLQRTLQAICDNNGHAIAIVNPYHGDHSDDGQSISELLAESFLNREEISAGVLLKKDMTVDDAVECCNAHAKHGLTLIHGGFTEGKGLADALGDKLQGIQQVFFEKYCGKLYRKHFEADSRILLRDGFQRMRNRDYPPVQAFSDLHITYPEEGMTGFGDFLIVGDEYSESGGPAYAVAIHLTFIDPSRDDAMFIYHFVSKSKDTPTDPAGKFGEALDLMMRKLRQPDNHIYESNAVREFRDLHRRGHFPGLGYIKKLSMMHHIETLNHFFAEL
jgi:hypothetical protein